MPDLARCRSRKDQPTLRGSGGGAPPLGDGGGPRALELHHLGEVDDERRWDRVVDDVAVDVHGYLDAVLGNFEHVAGEQDVHQHRHRHRTLLALHHRGRTHQELSPVGGLHVRLVVDDVQTAGELNRDEVTDERGGYLHTNSWWDGRQPTAIHQKASTGFW